MTGIGHFTWDAAGSQTAAATGVLRFTVGSAITPSFVTRDYGAYDPLWWPAQNAVLYANGIDFQYHIIDAVAYTTGPIAPYNAVTLAVTGATKASVVGTYTGQPVNNESFVAGRSPAVGGPPNPIYKNTLITDGSVTDLQVKIGVDADTTYANLNKGLNGTGTQGVEYFDYSVWAGLGNLADGISFTSAHDATANTVTFTDKLYGIIGNTAVSLESVTNFTFASVTFTGVTVGTGVAPASGTYDYANANLRTADSAQTAIGPEAEITLDGNSNVTVSAWDTPPTRDAIDFARIFRDTVDGSQLFRIGEKAIASSPYTDSTSDDDIDDTFFNEYDPAIYRPYSAGYPDRYLCHAMFKGCVFGGGIEPAAQRSAGTVSVTNGSRTVTFSAAAVPKEDWINRTFAVTGDATTDYVLNELVESSRVGTLNKPYEGVTGGTAAYTVTDDRDPCELTYSVPLFINNRPAGNSVKGIVSRDPAGVVGLIAQWGYLNAFTRTDAWRVQGEPEAGFDFNHAYGGCGAWNQSSVVSANGTVFWIGPNGVFGWGGDGEPENLSNPQAVQGQPRGIQGTIDAINRDAARVIVGNFNESQQVIRWWVPVDGSPYNNRVIVFSLRSGAFTVDECGPVTDARSMEGPDGATYTVAGGAFGVLWLLDVGNVDGGFGFESVQTISTYTASTRTVALTGSPALPTSAGGLREVPIYVKSANGAIQRGIIAVNTSGGFTLVTPFATAPAAGDQVNIGDIRLHALSSKSDYGTPESKKMLSSVTVAAVPTTGGQLWVAGSANDADPTLQPRRSDAADDDYDLTSTTGQHQFWIRRGPGNRNQVEIEAFGSGVDIAITNVTVVTRERSADRETVQ